mgnify:FL=1
MKAFSQNDIQTAQSFLTQLVDVIQEDISGSTTRRKYQVFVTGGVGPGITSSLFQTIYDQDFTLQTANPVLDMTVGLFTKGSSVDLVKTGEEASGRLLFPSESVMMREKVDIYREMAKSLLGDSGKAFYAPYDDVSVANSEDNARAGNNTGASAGSAEALGGYGSKTRIDEAIFMSFKRLFVRDGMKKETFAFKMYTSASFTGTDFVSGTNLAVTSEEGSTIFTDANSSDTDETAPVGGRVGNIVNSSNTNSKVGLVFYDRGIVVLDARKVLSGAQHVTGVISSMNANNPNTVGLGKSIIGDPKAGKSGNPDAKFIPDLFVSASIDDIVDHLASCRFSSGSLTAATFQNKTSINSTLYFARANADEFNYSSNTTFLDTNGNINVIDAAARQDNSQRSFAFVTKVGLHDAEGNLLAVAKLSRPVEKNPEKDITFRVRLDF